MSPDRIELRGIRARGFHGVHAFEREQGQEFVVDVVLHVDVRAAAAHDDLGLTVDYGDVAQAVHDRLTGKAFSLLEALAQRIADDCLAVPGVDAVEVAVHKPEAPVPVPFDDVVVRVLRHRDDRDQQPVRQDAAAATVDAVLALGANQGDRLQALRSAVHRLRALPGVLEVRPSPVYETAPVGGPPQGPFLNAVLLVRTTLAPMDLLRAVRAIEDDHGRDRTVRWGPRTLDIDVITYADLVSDDPALTLPHPRVHERAFVLAPWAAVDPAAVLPAAGGRPAVAVSRLLQEAGDADGVHLVPDADLAGEAS